MVIYKTTNDFGYIKKGTHLVFNKSLQLFETFDHEEKITNDESYRNPGLIIIHKILTNQSEKRRIINIPF